MMKKILSFIICLMLFAITASASTDGYYRGDLDGSKTITMTDLAKLIALLNTNPADMPKAADVNGDTKVNLDDVSALVEIILGKKTKVWVALPDDLSSDGTSTSGDVNDEEYNGEFDAKKR